MVRLAWIIILPNSFSELTGVNPHPWVAEFLKRGLKSFIQNLRNYIMQDETIKSERTQLKAFRSGPGDLSNIGMLYYTTVI
jgi:hypothetical protein